MADRIKDIRDDEFRVIGKHSSSGPKNDGGGKNRNRLVSILSLVLVLGIGILAILKWPKEKPEDPEDGLFEDLPEVVVNHEATLPFGSETDLSFTEKIDTVINDVVLSLYIPHNAIPELTLGVPDRNDKSIILAAQARKGSVQLSMGTLQLELVKIPLFLRKQPKRMDTSSVSSL